MHCHQIPNSQIHVGDSIYLLESGRGYLVRIDRQSGKREDMTFCPGFARGMAFVSHYAVVTVSLSRHVNFGGLPIDATMKASEVTVTVHLIEESERNYFRLTIKCTVTVIPRRRSIQVSSCRTLTQLQNIF